MPPNPEENFEAAVEDETGGAEAIPEEEDSKDISKEKDKADNSSAGKQGKIDDGDRMSNSSKQAPGNERTSVAGNSDTEPVVPPVVTQPVFQPPWPEWSDEFINEDTWDVDSGIDYFEDSFAATDFLNLKAYHWLRPSEFLRDPPSVVRFSSPVIDLITPNSHLCEKSEILRYILSEISELYDYSIQNKFVECEGEGVAYVPNYGEDDRRWTPWSHIYSCCKAGIRGEKPVYNAKGKYYVRLYFMGAWRRILVDDRIPVLPSGQSGLPLTSLNELWPMLLTKALLKVATVTWKGDDVKKFSAISALTGWVFEWIDNINGVNENELWADLVNTLPKYTDPKKIPSCYTLLHPSRKKRKFGDMQESDTFWWMPPYVVQASELEDYDLKEVAVEEAFEVDPLDIISSPGKPIMGPNADMEMGIKPVMEIKWKRKTVLEPPRTHSTHKNKLESVPGSSRNLLDPNFAYGEKGEELGDNAEGIDDKNETTPAGDGLVVAKKKKKKGIGAALDDGKSERKSVAAKKHKKQKEGGAVGGGPELGKSKLEKKKSKINGNDKNDGNDPQDTTDAPEEQEEDEKPLTVRKKSKSVKMRHIGTKHWEKLKDILMGGSDVPVRLSKSLRRSFVQRQDASFAATAKSSKRQKHGKRSEDEDDVPTITAEDFDDSAKIKKPVLPTVAEILYGVQKYAGIDYRNIVKNWENICGKDSPISLMVVLKNFPNSEEDTSMENEVPFVPAFLQHPIQLTEVRDTVLVKPTDRPETPLWKRFRWKKWAMKKGLIPMEEDHSKDIIRAVKAKTPFVFKTDWYDFATDQVEYEEDDNEFDGEDDDDDFFGGTVEVSTFFFSLKGTKRHKSKEIESFQLHQQNQLNQQLPPTPPPTNASPPQQGRYSRGNSIVPATGARLSRTGSTFIQQAQQDTLVPPGLDKKRSKRSIVAATSGQLPPSGIDTADTSRKSPPTNLEKTSSGPTGGLDGDKLEKTGSNTMLILHETDVMGGESEEDFDEGFKRKMLKSQEIISPSSACAALWFNCDDIARNLRKFCKFYTSQSIFGSCYILRREPTIPLKLNPLFYELHSELPKYPEALTNYKQNQDGLNLGIKFDRCTSYHVTDYHLDDREGIDSAFYLFSDCWTEQELIITVHVLQDEFLSQYNKATATPLNEEMPGPPPSPMSRGISLVPSTPSKVDDLPLTLVIEPWDWRQDTCFTKPLLVCTWINDRWISHINLPAGRNTFRIWLIYQNQSSNAVGKGGNHGSKIATAESGEVPLVQNDFSRKKSAVPFSVRIVSQTPIYVGSRTEVLNYMTNPPMLFLKQCERLANNLWGLFACFGKQRSVYHQNLIQLRRSYCPAYSQPNMINKFVRGSHDTFEELFVSLVTLFNDGKLDRKLILTLRVLFLNPMIGRRFIHIKPHRNSEDVKMLQGIFKGLPKKARWMLTTATLVIQKYYRGWRVRRLFQLRKRSHPDFKKIEYNVRRIAFLLAKETDSLFSQKDEITGEYKVGNFGISNGDGGYVSVADMSVDPEKVPPTILPSPPHWAVDLLRYLLERHPWLVAIHPHAQCVPHHVKIQEIEGELPQRVKFFSWYPFFRECLKVPPDSKSCFVELDLQVYPPLGIHMKVINNDNGKFLKTLNNRLFIGRLFENKYGYTILCYRWATPTLNQELNDRPSSVFWKLRLVTPVDQDGPRFQTRNEFLTQIHSIDDINGNENTVEDENRNSLEEGASGVKRDSIGSSSESEPIDIPNKLSLRRLTGYYTPNKDFSVCQYILETDEKRATVSVRFLASNPKAHFRVSIWDCAKKAVVFDEMCEGGLIAPCIQLHLARKRERMSYGSADDELAPITSDGHMEALHSPLSDVEGSKKSAGLLNRVMSGHSSKASFKMSLEAEEEENDDTGKHTTEAVTQHEERKHSHKIKKSSTPAAPVASPEKKVLTNKRRYIISVYVVEDTWLLSDRELLYVLYRERKFLRSIKSHHCKELVKQREEATKRAAEEAQQAAEAAAAAAAEAQQNAAEIRLSQAGAEQQLGGAAGIEFKLTVAPETTGNATTPTTGEPPPPEGKKDYKEFQSTKKKTKKKQEAAASAATVIPPLVGATDNSGNATTGPPPPTTAPQGDGTPTYPTTPPPTTISTIAIGEDNQKVEGESKKSKDKIKRRMNGNLQVKYGGHQCQNVKHLDQPHWIMEIVTDSKIKYKLKSNWEILRKRLLQAQESWEMGGVEVLYQDLSTRLDFLLENMVEENYFKVKQHKFSIVDPIANLYSCLRMDDYDLTELGNHEFIRLVLQAWSANPEESKKAGEKFLQNRLKKSNLLSELPDPKEIPKPEQLLDYIPKNLRKLAETFQLRIEERELERERLMRPGRSLDEDEDEGEEEEEGELTPHTTAAISEHSHPTDPDNATVKNDLLGVPRASDTARKTSDARTERLAMKKARGKALAIVKSQQEVVNNVAPSPVKSGIKKGKSERDRSASLKAKEGKGTNSAQETDQQGKGSRTSGAEETEKRKSGDASDMNEDKEPKVDYESELARIKGCSHVGEILKKYDDFFKEQKSVREALLEMILKGDEKQEQQQMGEIPKKLLLTKTGISKYAEKKDEDVGYGDEEKEWEGEGEEEPRTEKKSKESLVANKLLQWGFDFSLLPPTEESHERIEDPGELPLFLMRTIMEEQRIREELELELAAAEALAGAEEDKLEGNDE